MNELPRALSAFVAFSAVIGQAACASHASSCDVWRSKVDPSVRLQGSGMAELHPGNPGIGRILGSDDAAERHQPSHSGIRAARRNGERAEGDLFVVPHLAVVGEREPRCRRRLFRWGS